MKDVNIYLNSLKILVSNQQTYEHRSLLSDRTSICLKYYEEQKLRNYCDTIDSCEACIFDSVETSLEMVKLIE